MLCKSIKRFLYENRFALVLFVSLFFFTTDAFADGTFGALQKAGEAIFGGLKKIIWPASTIGIACVCIAGMFGNFNWKWLAAIVLGIFIIASAAGVQSLVSDTSVEFMDGND